MAVPPYQAYGKERTFEELVAFAKLSKIDTFSNKPKDAGTVQILDFHPSTLVSEASMTIEAKSEKYDLQPWKHTMTYVEFFKFCRNADKHLRIYK
jgi:hypothetical protein